eukprot:scaffold1152_cov235-Pinguiococcus_pyrenoidosus.AAC.2
MREELLELAAAVQQHLSVGWHEERLGRKVWEGVSFEVLGQFVQGAELAVPPADQIGTPLLHSRDADEVFLVRGPTRRKHLAKITGAVRILHRQDEHVSAELSVDALHFLGGHGRLQRLALIVQLRLRHAREALLATVDLQAQEGHHFRGLHQHFWAIGRPLHDVLLPNHGERAAGANALQLQLSVCWVVVEQPDPLAARLVVRHSKAAVEAQALRGKAGDRASDATDAQGAVVAVDDEAHQRAQQRGAHHVVAGT